VRIGRSSTGVTQFLSIGRLDYEGQKRVADLLTAAAKLKGNFDLTIIGDGDDRGKLEEYGRKLGLDSKIHWLGWKNEPCNSKPAQSISSCDAHMGSLLTHIAVGHYNPARRCS
jgi:glycosyltransferase involved in cell wall biosynthesis